MTAHSLPKDHGRPSLSLPALHVETLWLIAIALMLVATMGVGLMALPDAREPVDSPVHWSNSKATPSP